MITSQHLGHPEIPIELVELPPFSAIAVKVLQAASSEASQLVVLSNLISADAAFAGAILRIVNSPLFGIRKRIASILQATLLLGLDRIKGAAMTIGIRAYLDDALEAPAISACWRHSLACALVAGEMAQSSEVKEDVAYTAGVMHDIGRLALAVAYPNRYAQFLGAGQNDPYETLGRERDLFGIDHCQTGRALVTRWNFPESFVGVTSKHHDPVIEKGNDLLAIIRASCAIADALGFYSIKSLHSKKYEDLLTEVPEEFRVKLPLEPADLTLRIAHKINSIESV